jgi:hypothetical protein
LHHTPRAKAFNIIELWPKKFFYFPDEGVGGLRLFVPRGGIIASANRHGWSVSIRIISMQDVKNIIIVILG